jgi:hypothetical protein
VNPAPWANEKDRERFIENDRSKFLTAEDYYNNKYPKRDITTTKVVLGDMQDFTSGLPYKLYHVDVRTFLNSKSFRLPEIRANPNYDDAIALEGLRWVMENIKWTLLNDTGEIVPGGIWRSEHRTKNIVEDVTAQGMIEALVLSGENWSFSYQTLGRKNGDCEDGAILLYDILRNAGIPAWKLRLNAGFWNPDGTGGGHIWLSYYVESQFWKSKRDDKWVILDWCDEPFSATKVEDRIRHTEDKRYIVDYSFNEDYTWSLGKITFGAFLEHFGDCPAINGNDFYWRKQCTCGSKQCTCGSTPCKCGSKKCTCASNECTCPR